MNNLYRELAPISDKAWAQIEEEATRTLKRHLAARRVVDVPDPRGLEFSAVGTGHLHQIQASWRRNSGCPARRESARRIACSVRTYATGD